MSLYGRLFISAMGVVPKKALSRMVGRAATMRSQTAIRAFAQRYGASLEEAERPIEEYRNLQEFFTRRLKPGVRPLDPDPKAVLSPADGVVDEYGPIDGGELIQAKGRRYTLAALLGSSERAERYAGGHFATIYLSPKDYHRVHIPFTADVEGATYVPGALYPVNPHAVEHVDALFANNERIVSHLRSPEFGQAELVMVGATIVGSVKMVYDDALRTNAGQDDVVTKSYSGVRIDRGRELGVFQMGSTVILVFEPKVKLDAMPKGKVVKVGQRIGSL